MFKEVTAALDQGATQMYQHILIATDGSVIAGRAVDQGVRLAKACGARVTVLTVMDELVSLHNRDQAFAGLPDVVRQQALASLEHEARKAIEDAEASAKGVGVSCETELIVNRHPHDAIVQAAHNKGADLIVMGSHGRSGVKAVLLGSVTAKVLSHGKVPTLVYR